MSGAVQPSPFMSFEELRARVVPLPPESRDNVELYRFCKNLVAFYDDLERHYRAAGSQLRREIGMALAASGNRLQELLQSLGR